MRSLHDTSAIQRLIGRARVRIRLQWALEGAATATVLAAAAALAVIFALRAELIASSTATLLLVGTGLMIVAGAVISALRPLDDERVARRIDRASNLSDRLSTAIAFRRTMASADAGATTAPTGSIGGIDDETTELMAAAIRDGVKAVPRANIRAAAPFAAPRDLRAALGFLAVSAIAAGLALPTVDRSPHLVRADPSAAPPGAEVTLIGSNLMAGLTTPMASLPARHVIGAPDVPAAATASTASPGGYVPLGASVYLGPSDQARPVVVLDWTRESIRIRIPADAPLGDTQLTAHVGTRAIGPVAFTVVDPKDSRFHKESSVQLDPDERAYVEAILGELKRIAQRDKIEDLDKFAKTIEQLLEDAEQGKITKEQLLEQLAKAEELLNQGAEPDAGELAKQMAELGKELEKNQQTKELGEALKKNDLEKAKQELEELAAKLDPKGMQQEKEELEKQLQDKTLSEQQKQDLEKKLEQLKQQQAQNEKQPMTEQQKQELAKQLDQVSKQMQKQQQDQQKKQDQQQQKLEEQVRRLQKEKDEAKTPQQQQEAERRLQQKKDELKKLQKEAEQKQQSAQREAVKRLQKDLEKAAEQLQKPQDKQESKEEQEEREQQASQKLKDAARETGRVDQDQRKQATQKKMSSQMDDLREAMRRAKQKGNKGPQDPFNKNGRNKDFQARARGQKGQGQGAWKPGQGQQGQGTQPGQGQGSGGDKWGTGHDPNLTGDATDKGGNTKDQDLQGKAGNQGNSTRETILSAAQKGFASKGYQKVYADYQRIVEEVMRTEKLPSSYKYYVKRYFAKIHPSAATELDAVDAPEAPAPKANP
ncbi:MAG: hypothetical protein M3680_05170 [Myxococcota bacterium]|nr:hypothetical protein [Myxococcota bacterium]